MDHWRAVISKVGGATNSGEIHANGLLGVDGLEPAFEVAEGRLSICTTR